MAVEMTLDATQVDALAEALLRAGADSVDVADAAAGTDRECPIFAESGDDALSGWSRNRLTALFPADADLAAALAAASKLAARSLPEYRVKLLDDQDWVHLTQRQFAPMRISNRLWIVPSWHRAPEPGAINIVLDPGLAFGTGSHPTTRLCLRWLDEWLESGQSVVDYGCGSGILAIAAAKLGASRVTGVDIDPQALQSSRYNARLNNIAAAFISAADPAPDPADVVLANILSSPLKVLAPLLAGLVRSGGRLVLSGVLAAQAEDVAQAYSAWFEMQIGAADQGWVRLEALKRQDKTGQK
ncbi:MAG: 50S ribosomal protein L11 methyltransferase [Burkholderiales bacterium]